MMGQSLMCEKGRPHGTGESPRHGDAAETHPTQADSSHALGQLADRMTTNVEEGDLEKAQKQARKKPRSLEIGLGRFHVSAGY